MTVHFFTMRPSILAKKTSSLTHDRPLWLSRPPYIILNGLFGSHDRPLDHGVQVDWRPVTFGGPTQLSSTLAPLGRPFWTWLWNQTKNDRFQWFWGQPSLIPIFVVSLIQVYSCLNSDKSWGIFCYTKSISNFHFRKVDLIRLDHLRLIYKQGQSLKIKSGL